MNLKRTGFLFVASTALACLSATAIAQDFDASVVGDPFYEGQAGGISAWSLRTTSCNIGSVVVQWNDGAGQAPVIATNIYRVANGRFEQLGSGWLKYSFCAVNEGSCGSCMGTDCNTLGIGCADTYGSSLNDGANGGGGKWQIPPTTGGWVFPGPRVTSSGSLPLRGRINTEIARMTEPGARVFMETHYISEHDQMAGNGRNNATWREANVNSATSLSNLGPNRRGDPAIFAWQDVDPAVNINEVVVLNEGGTGVHGYHFVGYKASQIDPTHWRYEYAVHNFNSELGMHAFEIPLGCDTAPVITDLYYYKADHHSGDFRNNNDWVVTIDGDKIRWEANQTVDINPWANANWWDETLTVGFTADMPPAMVQASLIPFQNGGPPALVTTVEGPCGGPICGVETFCALSPNSSGPGSAIGAAGSNSIAVNTFKLTASGATPNAFGLFYYGPNQVQVPFGDGLRCVGGMTQRLQGPIQITGAGTVARGVDFTLPPVNGGNGLIEAGDTVSFQFWFRDAAAGMSGFNLSDGVTVTFCP